MKSYLKISLLFSISLMISIVSISATPIHYGHTSMVDVETPVTPNATITTTKKAKKQKGKWFRNLFKKRKNHVSKKRSSKKLKRSKRKLLWNWFKNQFKSKKKRKSNGSHIEFWSLASFFLGFIALLSFIAAIALDSFFTTAGIVTGLSFYLILGVTSFLFAEWGQRNIDLYPDYYSGRSLTKWAKGMVLLPITLLAISLLVFLLDF